MTKKNLWHWFYESKLTKYETPIHGKSNPTAKVLVLVVLNEI